MKTIYFFSGLGADERVFQFLDLSYCKPVFIKWEIPSLNESLSDYVNRISAQIIDKDAALVGVSFGGMIAIEVAKIIKPAKVIVISSAKTKYEIPFYYRIAGVVFLHKLIPVSWLQRLKSLNHIAFGVQKQNEQEILDSIIRDTNPVFLKWAIDKIARWKNVYQPQNLIHIHGDYDRILPPSFVKADYWVKDGTHFMILQKSGEISKLLKAIL